MRVKVGDEAFFAATREWLERYDDSTGTTEDFVAVFEEESGQDLTEFFDIWLRTAREADDLVGGRAAINDRPGGLVR